MNDSEQLFTLQKAFLLPQQVGGRCLTIYVTVGGRIDITIYDPEYYCERYYLNECIFEIKKSFELLPAPAITLVDFLRSSSIVQALAVMDPSFHILISGISNDLIGDPFYNDFDPSYNSYNIHLKVGNIDLSDPSEIEDDTVTDALYVILSWLSYS
jgi:hypothetical protein